jgi:hypothetical protein
MKKVTGVFAKILILALVISSLFVSAAYADVDSKPGAKWLLDGTGTDSSGNRNHGSLSGAATVADGIHRQALHFNGTSTVKIADRPTINFASSNFSISCWFRSGTVNQVLTLLDKMDTTNNTGYRLKINFGILEFDMGDQSGNYREFYSNNWITYNDNQWHLIVITAKRNAADGLKMYYDNQLVGGIGDPTQASGSITSRSPLYIAMSTQSPTFNFIGDIDEVSLYDRELFVNEVQELYLNRNCVAKWSLNGKGEDSSGNFNNGKLRGSPNPAVEDGISDIAMNFSSNNYIEVPNNSTINFGTGDFSVAFWIKTTQQQMSTIIDKRITNLPGTGYLVALTNGRPSIMIADNFVQSTFVAVNSAPINDGLWHYVAITVDRDNPSGLSFFIDTMQTDIFNPGIVAGSISNTVNLYMGKDRITQANCLKGSLDEVKLYNKAITSEQIKEQYANNDCVAHWRLNGDGEDTGGKNNNGALVGAPVPLMVTGIDGTALDFNSNNYVAVQDRPSIDFGAGDFSISAWFNTTNRNSINTILDKRDNNNTGYLVALYQGNLMLQIGDTLGFTNYYNSNLSTPLNDGIWHQVVITVDRDNALGLKFYIDGVLTNTFNATDRRGNISNNATLYIGRHRDGAATDNFLGTIDDIWMFNRELNFDEALQMPFK